MKRVHVPKIDLRYWIAITLSSIFGTNLGDLYAHKSGLGLMQGAGLLAVLAAIAFAIERFDSRRHQVYYWLVIIIIRTGATNVADWLAYIAKVPPVALGLGMIGSLSLFAWLSIRETRKTAADDRNLPKTGAAYWLAMLAAGVFGTLAGDLCSDNIGQGISSLSLGAVLALVLFLGRRRNDAVSALYWTTVAIARTAGTAMGDWMAENKIIEIGLTVSTVVTGVAFVAVLLFWRSSFPKPESEDARLAAGMR